MTPQRISPVPVFAPCLLAHSHTCPPLYTLADCTSARKGDAAPPLHTLCTPPLHTYPPPSAHLPHALVAHSRFAPPPLLHTPPQQHFCTLAFKPGVTHLPTRPPRTPPFAHLSSTPPFARSFLCPLLAHPFHACALPPPLCTLPLPTSHLHAPFCTLASLHKPQAWPLLHTPLHTPPHSPPCDPTCSPLLHTHPLHTRLPHSLPTTPSTQSALYPHPP